MTDVKYDFDLAYGPGSAAEAGRVMLRIARERVILAEIHMTPDTYLDFAHSIENVGRSVASDKSWQDEPGT